MTIPITGVFFLKRQWLMGKRYGFVTPGEMYQAYFGSEARRILTVVVALFFSIPYLGIQLRASGVLCNILTDGIFSVNVGMWMLAMIVALYVGLGGLRSVAYVNRAVAYSHLGENKKAIVDYEKRLELGPEIDDPPGFVKRLFSNEPHTDKGTRKPLEFLKQQVENQSG